MRAGLGKGFWLRVALAATALSVVAVVGGFSPAFGDDNGAYPGLPPFIHLGNGNVYHVSTSGSDSNSGLEWDSAWLTLQKATKVVRPGDTVLVASGTYNIDDVGNPWKNTTSGRAGDPITFMSYQRWGAKLVATGMGASGHDVFENRGDYVQIIGFDITGNSTTSGGIENFVSGPGTVIANNRVHDISGANCTTNGGDGILDEWYAWGQRVFRNPTGGALITGNLVFNVGPAPGTCYTVQGIYIANPNDTVSNNIVYNVTADGISLWHGATRATIVNNLVFNTNSGITVGAGDAGELVPNDFTNVFNNIVLNTNYGILEYCYDSDPTCTGTHNLYDSNIVDSTTVAHPWQLRNGLTPTHWVNATASATFERWAADGSGDYHLKAGSPAIGAANSLGLPSTDFDNERRPTAAGALQDIGPYMWRTRQD